ncbi:NADH-quinone oxidoreductase subunit C [Candidatus Acetothermia bacterium]|nr:NADH-quinone oxidoreductase subunit C [Candidatus Acetothermia bacterium]MBI3643320.1 NADH-quinone oxidoreductase subunit C [Candidatus Acetothermia bacterium]
MAEQPLVDQVVEKIRAKFSGAIEQEEVIRSGYKQLTIKKSSLLDALRLAKTDFPMLYDLTAADYLEREPFFHVIYVMNSIQTPAKLFLKVKVERENSLLPTASKIFPMANWFERELYDFYGINFEGHPDLKRLLMPDDWMGHPLRKEYALTEEPVEFKGLLSDKLPSEVIPKQYD